MKKPFRNGTFWLVSITFVLITLTGIVFRQAWYRILPLYVSLAVMLLQTRANRYCFLLGGVNSLLYAVVYFSLGLYASFMNCILVSFPMQIVTFIRWNKKAYGNSTQLKCLSAKMRTIGLLTASGLWVILFLTLRTFGSQYVILDNTVTVIGFIGTALSLFRYIEYSFVSIVSCFISLALHIDVVSEVPGQVTYIVYTLYSLVCCIISFRFMTKLYKKQKEEL